MDLLVANYLFQLPGSQGREQFDEQSIENLPHLSSHVQAVFQEIHIKHFSNSK